MGISLSIFRRSPVFYVDGELVETSSLRADALLVYLCLSGEIVHTRESLACLLWEDADTKRAMGSLRQLARKTRLAAPGLESYLRFERAHVSVAKESISTDIDGLRNALISNDLSEIPDSYDFTFDDILTRFTGISSTFDSWIAMMRNQLENQICDLLGQTIQSAQSHEATRVHAARALVHFDPAHEPATRYLMQAEASAGNHAAALETYNNLYHALDSIHDAEPSDETQDLVAQIKVGTFSGDGPKGELQGNWPTRISPRIYVPEFTVEDSDQQIRSYISVFRHDLIVNLSTFREWHLFDAEPAEEDGYRLEGLAGRTFDQIFIIAILKRTSDNRIIWSERFEIGYDTWASVQRDIAKRLSLAMNTGLSLDRLRKATVVSLESPDLFDQWMQAQSDILEWKTAKLDNAARLLDGVLSQAPGFAPARASRANVETIRHLVAPGVFRTESSLRRGMEHANLALKADPLDSRAHLALGWSLAMSDRHTASLFHFETCRELNPCSALCNLACGLGFAFAGQTDKAARLTRQTLSLVRDIPPYLWGYVQNIRFLDRDIDGAVEAGERAGGAIANLPAWQIAALWEAGEKDQAVRLAREFCLRARRHWQSSRGFSQTALIDWFLSCFPLSDPDQTNRLRLALTDALSEAILPSAASSRPLAVNR